jgi:hypothetical protein
MSIIYRFVNGCSAGQFSVVNSLGNIIENITLPIYSNNGCLEGTEEKKIAHEAFQDYETTEEIEGWKLYWTCSFEDYFQVEYMEAMERILNFRKQGYNLRFRPRADVHREFDVIFEEPKVYEDGILYGGIYAKGNKGMVLKLKSKHMETDLQYVNRNNIPIWTDGLVILNYT